MVAAAYSPGLPHSRSDLAIGFLVSLAIFVGAPLLSSWSKSGPPRPKRVEEVPHLQLVMPKIEPEEEEPVEQTAAAQPADIAPPMQADVPQLTTDTSFVQKLEPPPPEGMAIDRSAIVVPAVAGGFGKGGQIFDPSMLDQQPVATYQPHPLYPYDMKKQGIGGNVNVEFVLTPDGSVQNAFALSSTQHEFEAAAIQAVTKWRFRPGRRGGRAVNTRMQVQINFTLDNSE